VSAPELAEYREYLPSAPLSPRTPSRAEHCRASCPMGIGMGRVGPVACCNVACCLLGRLLHRWLMQWRYQRASAWRPVDRKIATSQVHRKGWQCFTSPLGTRSVYPLIVGVGTLGRSRRSACTRRARARPPPVSQLQWSKTPPATSSTSKVHTHTRTRTGTHKRVRTHTSSLERKIMVQYLLSLRH
jgi:hypothetical protein